MPEKSSSVPAGEMSARRKTTLNPIRQDSKELMQ